MLLTKFSSVTIGHEKFVFHGQSLLRSLLRVGERFLRGAIIIRKILSKIIVIFFVFLLRLH